MKKVEFGPCCFCGKAIEESKVDPCRVTVSTKDDKWQVWFCHSDCFKTRIAEHPMDLSPAHF